MKTFGRLLAVLVLLVGITAAGAQEVLTNDAVVAMKKAGLSEGVILAKIRSSPSKFDTSSQALVGLKQAGLSDAIIEAMLGAPASGTPATTPRAAATPSPAPAAPVNTQTIFHLSGAQYVELVPAIASIETNFQFFTSKSELVLKGRKAPYRVKDGQPVFYSAWAPNEVPPAMIARKAAVAPVRFFDGPRSVTSVVPRRWTVIPSLPPWITSRMRRRRICCFWRPSPSR